MESKKGLTSSPSSTAQLTLSDGDVWGGPSPNLSVAMRGACRNFTHMEGEGVSAEGMNSHSYLQVLIFMLGTKQMDANGRLYLSSQEPRLVSVDLLLKHLQTSVFEILSEGTTFGVSTCKSERQTTSRLLLQWPTKNNWIPKGLKLKSTCGALELQFNALLASCQLRPGVIKHVSSNMVQWGCSNCVILCD